MCTVICHYLSLLKQRKIPTNVTLTVYLKKKQQQFAEKCII